LLTGSLLLSAPLAEASPPDSFAPIIDPLLPAVVNISTTQKVVQQNNPFFDLNGMPDTPQTQQFKQLFKQFQGNNGQPMEREVTSLGSGFVIDADGYVVTNNHVVGNADKITVIFQDNTHLPATIIGRDDKTDLVLLKVKPVKPLPALKFGDSDAMRVGDWVIAVGNPFGLGGSVSAGIVSARGRNINAGPFDDFIQTDAAINRGNSGGPLFNTKGEVVGINSAIFSPTGGNIGIGFAIPSAMAKTVVTQLREYGTIHRGWLGVKIEAVSDELANSLGLSKTYGALLSDVNKGGPAAAAGLQAGDVITKFDGHEIDEMRKLPRLVADTKIGKKVDITYWRKGHETTTQVTVGELPADQQKEADSGATPGKKSDQSPVLGMQLTPITKALRAQLSIDPDVKGLVVESIDMNGEAAKRGIMPGDVILEVNQSPTLSTDAVKAALDAAKKAGRDFALVRILRRGELLFVTVAVK
jgi:serine protease Do